VSLWGERMAVKSQTFRVVLLAGVCAAFLPWGCASDSENEAEAHFNEGKALHEKDEWHAAIDCFTKAIALNPQFVEAYRHRGTLYLKVP